MLLFVILFFTCKTYNSKGTPFAYGRGEGIDAGSLQSEWVVEKERHRYDEVFQSLEPVDGKVSGQAAKQEMIKSKLPNAVLGKVQIIICFLPRNFC